MHATRMFFSITSDTGTRSLAVSICTLANGQAERGPSSGDGFVSPFLQFLLMNAEAPWIDGGTRLS